jgi:hypothetical protein
MPGNVRNILLTIEVRPAGRRCRCAHNKRHQILKGETRVVIKNPGAPGDTGYCAACGRAMVTTARHELTRLETALGMTPMAPTTSVQEDALSSVAGLGAMSIVPPGSGHVGNVQYSDGVG